VREKGKVWREQEGWEERRGEGMGEREVRGDGVMQGQSSI